MVLEWLGPALTGFKHREEIGDAFAHAWSYVFGKKTSLAFTGMQGVGKSVLLDHLTGRAFEEGYKPPMQSQRVETGKIRTGGRRLLVSVVPGQRGAQPRLESIDKIFKGSKPVQGVVHVVANGFATIRNEVAAQVLIQDNKINTIAKFRAHQLARELEDLEETCQAIRDAHRKNHSPAWMVVAVDKVDLYQADVLEARAYYSLEGDSPFADRLRRLLSQVGTDFFRIQAIPVCTWREDFVWHKQTANSGVSQDIRNAYLAQFVDELKNFC